MVNYLLAAEAAQQRGDEARANQHLERATELAGDDLDPGGNHSRSACSWLVMKITLRAMASISCWKLPRVIRKCCASPNRHTPAPAPWQSLLDIIPSMAKANVGDEAHRAALEQLAWVGLMDKALADGGSEGLREWWRNQSR